MKLDTCSFEISRVKIARGESSNCFDLAMVILLLWPRTNGRYGITQSEYFFLF